MKKLIFALFLITSLCLYTQTKSFVREYTYKAGEADSKLSSKTLALKEVKTLLLEEVGVYLSSEFENKIEQKEVNGNTEFKQLTKSNIVTLAAGITKTTILDEKWNGETYYLKAEIIVDLDDAKMKLNELVNDKAKTKELEDIQAKNKEANDEIDKLNKELETAKAKNIELSEKDKTRIQEDYNAKINILYANEWFQKGNNAFQAKEYQNAIIYYNEAIQLKPDNADAYNHRGLAKKNLKDYTGAIADYNQAIQLNPDDAMAYNNRGNAKYDLQDYTGAITDYSKVIQLKPDYADAYNNRGVVKKKTLDYTGAIADYNKAIQLNPDDGGTYNNRGLAKSNLKDYYGAIADYNQYIQLNPDNATAYFNRGSAKYSLKDMNGACKDWSKAGELGDTDAYNTIQKYCKYPIKNEIIEPSNDLKTASLDPDVFLVVEENAEFPGGLAAMGKYMRDNMNYPDSARAKGISGKCFLKFVVNETGEISNVEVIKGVPGCPDCDKEAIRVAKSMPKWKPAKMNDTKVKCYFNLPFNFKITD